MRDALKLALLTTVMTAATTVTAQQAATGQVDLAKTVRRVAMNRTADNGQQPVESVITGMAVAANNAPIPNVLVHLRNLETKQVEQRATTNHLGEFMFVVKPQIPYVVEIADQGGRIFSASDVVTAQYGEVAGALVTMPAEAPAVAGMFRSATASVLAAAAGTGFTAVEASKQPVVSPER